MYSFRTQLALCLVVSAALPGAARAANGTWITLNGTTPWSTTTNWSGGTVADGVNFTASFTADINGPLNVTLNDVGRTIGNITFTDSTTDSHDMTISGSNALTLDRTSGAPVIVVNSSNRALTISSQVAGTDGLQKGGPGSLILSNTSNSYTGATTISEGTLSISSIGNVGGGSSAIGAPTTATEGRIQIGQNQFNGILRYTGGTQSSNRTIQVNAGTSNQQGGASIINDGTGALTFTAPTFNNTYSNANAITRTLTLGGTNGGTIEGTIVNNSGTALTGLAKTGTGTWTLAGTNTNTGNTSLSGGGTLVLDYSTNDTNKIAGVLTLGGGTLSLAGATGSHVEVVTSTAVSGGTTITRSGANTARLRLNTLTRTLGTISFQDGTVADTDTTNINNILGGWATVGNDWAMNSTNGADGAITAFNSYNGTLPNSGAGSSVANYTLNGTQTQTSTVAANTVRIAGTGSGDTLALGNNTLTITSNGGSDVGGILYVGGGDNVYNITNTSGSGLDASSAVALIITTVTGTLDVSATINGSNGARNLIKAGAGTLVVSSANAYTGIVRVNEGVLRVANNTATGTTAGGIDVQNGAALELSNSVAVGAEGLTITGMGVSDGGALRNVASNTSSYAGGITIGTSGARINSDAGGALTLTGGVVTSLFNNVTFGGAGNSTVSTAAISGAGGLVKDGNGVLNLDIGSTYSGPTTVSAGTLLVNNPSGSATGTGLVTLASGARLGGNGTIGGSLNVSGVVAPGNSPGVLAVTGDTLWNGAASASAATDWIFELAAGNNDLLDITGSFLKDTTSGSTFRFDFAGSAEQGTFVLVNWGGNTSFSSTDFSYTNLGGGNSGSFSFNGSQLEFVVVPEPETIMFLGAGITILGLRLVRRRQAVVRDRG